MHDMILDLMAMGWTGRGICGQILGSEIGPRQHPMDLVVGCRLGRQPCVVVDVDTRN